MNDPIRRPIAAFVAAACVLAAGAADAATGARVLVQEWSPLAPDQQSVKVLVDQPSLVSDSLARTWSIVRPSLCTAIKAQLGISRIAAGQTLRDIECNLDPNMTLDLRQNGVNSILATLTLPQSSITATSTQPTVCGSECDPRFSVSARAQIILGIAIQQDPSRPLTVTTADLKFSEASIDSHNFAADVIKWVDDNLVPFFRSSNFQKLATDAINNVQFHFASRFNDALGPVNAQLRGPAQYVRVGLWARSTRISIAFAPPELTPPASGSMTGLVRWNPERTLSTTQDAPLKCAAIHLVSVVQTGPAPLLDPDDYSRVGVAPTRQLGSFGASSAGDACNYTLSGIASTWPNRVNATMAGGNGGSIVTTSFVITPDGWNGVVVPNPAAPGHNYLVAERISGVASKVDIAKKVRNPGDPVINPMKDVTVNPAAIRTQPAAVVTPPVAPVNPATKATTPPSPLTRGATPGSVAAVKTPATVPQSTLGR